MPALTEWKVPPANQPRSADYAFDLDHALASIVGVHSIIPPDAFTADTLGTERAGNGVIIDDGLVLTIGYLITEAEAVWLHMGDGRVVQGHALGFDAVTGFGLVQALGRLDLDPLPIGSSAIATVGDRVVLGGVGGRTRSVASQIAAKQEFAGYWEYLLDEAIFTAPPHPAWSGAALISHDGKLVGVGSLVVGDASGKGDGVHGNMFVPIDRLAPILADLIADGRPAVAHPWLGLNTDDVNGHLVVSRVTSGAPAEKAGLRKGDIILAVNGETPKSLPDFYRMIWSQGDAGADIPLDVLQNHQRRSLQVHSINRLDQLKLKSSF